ncbi:hypothetical protein BH10ACT7_BH10ACT7_19190 [soil metagenome]
MVIVVTNPGELEKVPIKVVPIYIEPVLEEYVDPATPEAEATPPVAVPRSSLIGQLAFIAALLTVVAHIVAVVVASGNLWATGTVIGWVAIGLSALAVVGGTVAIILRRGSRYGIAAIVLGLIANPYLLLMVLRFFSGAQV